MGIIRGVHLVIVKRYRFPEPVFNPQKLKGSILTRLPIFTKEDYTFLSDAKRIKRMIRDLKHIEVNDIGIIKPIRNPYTFQELYWKPFVPVDSIVSLGIRPDLTMFPFQVIPKKIKIVLNQSWIERIMGCNLSELKFTWQVKIYPPGVCTADYNLFLAEDKQGLNLDGLVNLKNNFSGIPFRAEYKGEKHSQTGVFYALDYLFDKVVSNMIKGEYKWVDDPGYYAYYNLQGESIKLSENIQALSELFRCGKESTSNIVNMNLKGEHENDILAINRRVSIVSIDDGLRKENKTQKSILKGRRCFWFHFIASVEFAYITETLVKIYNRNFTQILREFEKSPLSTTWASIIKKYTTRGILDPCAYGTLQNEILDIPERLEQSRNDGFWKYVFIAAASDMALMKKLRELNTTTKKVYEKAIIYRDKHSARVAKAVSNTQTAIKTLLDIIKTVRPLP